MPLADACSRCAAPHPLRHGTSSCLCRMARLLTNSAHRGWLLLLVATLPGADAVAQGECLLANGTLGAPSPYFSPQIKEGLPAVV